MSLPPVVRLDTGPDVLKGAAAPTRSPQATTLALVAADVLSLSTAVGLSFFLSHWAGRHLSAIITLRYPVTIAATILALAYADLYPAPGIGILEEGRRVVEIITIVQLAAICGLLAMGASTNRLQTFSAWAISMMLVPLGRSLTRSILSRRPWWGESVLLIGSGAALAELHDLLLHDSRLGLHPAAVLNESGPPVGVAGLPEFHDRNAGLEFARERKIHTAVALLGGQEESSLPEVTRKYGHAFTGMIFAPPISPWCKLGSGVGVLDGWHTIRVSQGLTRLAPRVLKRCGDLLIAVAMFLTLAPMMALIAVAIKLTSRGPVFFGHPRIGKHGAPFRAWKFRTMVKNAGAHLAERLAADPELLAEWRCNHKLRKDPRVTKIGALLRKTSADELPQLWNVIRGEMSIVGPRPIIAEEVGRYGEFFHDYARVRPGITGLWQVSGRNAITYQERVQMDTHYVNHWSLWLDLYVLSRTLRAVFSGHGAF